MNDIEQRISSILVRHFGVDGDKVTSATHFRTDMSADSLDLIDLKLSVEDAFGIEISDDTAAELHTVGALIAYVRSQGAELRVA